jgi:hypothetical protein
MKKTAKRKWTKALRGGAIKQADGALKTPEGAMCCLGVLAHVCGGVTRWTRPRYERSGEWLLPVRDGVQLYRRDNRGDAEAYLSDAFCEEVGLTALQMKQLASMNDAGRSFSEIADFIDAKL